jgi:hypothetical protein
MQGICFSFLVLPMLLARGGIPLAAPLHRLDLEPEHCQTGKPLLALGQFRFNVFSEIGHFGQASVSKLLPDALKRPLEQIAGPTGQESDVHLQRRSVRQLKAASGGQGRQRRQHISRISRFQVALGLFNGPGQGRNKVIGQLRQVDHRLVGPGCAPGMQPREHGCVGQGWGRGRPGGHGGGGACDHNGFSRRGSLVGGGLAGGLLAPGATAAKQPTGQRSGSLWPGRSG